MQPLMSRDIPAGMSTRDPIVLIHGLWMTPLSWEQWVERYRERDERAPLLLIAGGADHVVPAAVDRQMAHKQSKSKAVTEYKEFPGRSHFTIGQDGWEEVADYALRWAVEHAR